MRTTPAGKLAAGCLAAILTVSPAGADEITRATLTIDATGAPVVVRARLTWTADDGGQPRPELPFWLAPGVTPVSAAEDGRELVVRSGGEQAGRRGWSVRLATPLPAGQSRALDLTIEVTDEGAPGIRPGTGGGRMLPGAGWFPSTAPELDERLAHSTEILTPEGLRGVAAGERPGGASWTTTVAARPYAVWGALDEREVQIGEWRAVAFRPPGAAGEIPRGAQLADIVSVVEAGVGEIPGSGTLKLVHVGDGVTAGGLRTVFWDETIAASPGTSRAALLIDRDLAGALATAVWTERFRFRGDQAAFLSRAVPLYLGDVAVIALDESDDLTPTERIVVGTRRDEFVRGRSAGDRPLALLPPTGAESEWVLSTRGALLAHQIAEACPSRAHFVQFLGGFRESAGGGDADAVIFAEQLGTSFPGQHEVLWPLFNGTDLPDFRIVGHGVSEKKGSPARYRVSVENSGDIAGSVDVSTFASNGYQLRTFRMALEPGQTRNVLFRDVGRIAVVELDPRGVVLQRSLEKQRVEAEEAGDVDLESFVPSFPFAAASGDLHEVEGLTVELPTVTIRDFSGYLQYWQTHHGPSGAVLLGEATVEIRPDGQHAESFRQQLGKAEVSFPAKEIFVRFPLADWAQFEPALGAAVHATEGANLAGRRRNVFEHSFPTYYFEDARAQVPPPGGVLVTFGLTGNERRGWLRMPLPDGTVKMRLWDHLRGQTIWEETR